MAEFSGSSRVWTTLDTMIFCVVNVEYRHREIVGELIMGNHWILLLVSLLTEYRYKFFLNDLIIE